MHSIVGFFYYKKWKFFCYYDLESVVEPSYLRSSLGFCIVKITNKLSRNYSLSGKYV